MSKFHHSVDELLIDMGHPSLSEMNRIGAYEKEFEELGEAIGKRFYLGHKGTIHARYLKVAKQAIDEIRELQMKLAEANKIIHTNIQGMDDDD